MEAAVGGKALSVDECPAAYETLKAFAGYHGELGIAVFGYVRKDREKRMN